MHFIRVFAILGDADEGTDKYSDVLSVREVTNVAEEAAGGDAGTGGGVIIRSSVVVNMVMAAARTF